MRKDINTNNIHKAGLITKLYYFVLDLEVFFFIEIIQ